jgi:hypothetical protein
MIAFLNKPFRALSSYQHRTHSIVRTVTALISLMDRVILGKIRPKGKSVIHNPTLDEGEVNA